MDEKWKREAVRGWDGHIKKTVVRGIEAVESVLHERNEEPSYVKLFAVCVTCLNQSAGGEQVTTFSIILSALSPRIAASVWQMESERIGKLLRLVLAKYAGSEFSQSVHSTAVCKALMPAFGYYLAGQSKRQWLKSPIVYELFQLVTSLLIDAPDVPNAVRVAAQHSLQHVFGSFEQQLPGNLVNYIVRFALQIFESIAVDPQQQAFVAQQRQRRQQELSDDDDEDDDDDDDDANNDREEQSQADRMIQLLVAMRWARLSSKHVADVCQSLLKLLDRPTLRRALTRRVYSALGALFDVRGGVAADRHAFLVRLLAIVMSVPPGRHAAASGADATMATVDSLTVGYAQLLAKLLLCLHSFDESMCWSKLPALFRGLFASLHSAKVAQCLCTLVGACVTPRVVELALADERHPLRDVVSTLDGAFAVQHRAKWLQLLRVYAALMEALGGEGCAQLGGTAVRALVAWQDDAVRNDRPFVHAGPLRHAIGVAVQQMSPRRLFKLAPLRLDPSSPEEHAERRWLLPLLAQHVGRVGGASLSLFHSFFARLAHRLEVEGERMAADDGDDTGGGGSLIGAEHRFALRAQLWNVFPGACRAPIDPDAGFRLAAPEIARCLSKAPHIEQVLRPIAAGLRQLLGGDSANDESRAAGAALAPSFLPLLFNLVERMPVDFHVVLHDTIGAFLSVATEDVVAHFARAVIKKLLAADRANNSGTLRSLSALALDFVPHLRHARGSSKSMVAILFAAVEPHLSERGHVAEKQAYKILAAICECHGRFVLDRFDRLRELLLANLATCAPSSKRSRLRCLVALLGALESRDSGDQDRFLRLVLPEVILCSKESNSKARLAAYELLIDIGRRQFVERDRTRRLFEVAVAGLAGGPHIVSATVLALARLLFEFRAHVDADVLSKLMAAVLQLLASQSREILKATLSFAKVAVIVSDNETLRAHLRLLVERLMSSENAACKAHFRAPIRTVLKRLLRRVDYEDVLAYFPRDDVALLNHVRRSLLRRRRKRLRAKPSAGHSSAAAQSSAEAEDAYQNLLQDSDDDDNDDGDGDNQSKSAAAAKQRRRGGESLADDDDDDAHDDVEALYDGYDQGEKNDGDDGEKQRRAALDCQRAKRTENMYNKQKRRGGAWILEGGDDGDNPLDFLDDSALTRLAARKPRRGDRDGVERTRKLPYQVAKDGRWIIEDLDAIVDGDETRASAASSSGTIPDDALFVDNTDRSQRKRNIVFGDDDDDDDEIDQSSSSRKRGRGGADDGTIEELSDVQRAARERQRREQLKAKRQRRATQSHHTGQRYRNKGGGDKKLRGKVDPYAYMPLDPSTLNKRSRARASAQYKSIVGKGRKKRANK
jgi:Ribosomal RNA-processing protein 12, HEAT repeats